MGSDEIKAWGALVVPLLGAIGVTIWRLLGRSDNNVAKANALAWARTTEQVTELKAELELAEKESRHYLRETVRLSQLTGDARTVADDLWRQLIKYDPSIPRPQWQGNAIPQEMKGANDA